LILAGWPVRKIATFNFDGSIYREKNPVAILFPKKTSGRRNSGNGQDILIKYSERSDLDKPSPKGPLNEKSKKNELFSISCLEHPSNSRWNS